MRHRVVLTALAVAAVAAVSLACSASDDAPATSTTCSTGTPYTDDTIFPEGAADPGAHECIRRCDDTSTATWGGGGASAPAVSALPTGSCAIAGETCHLAAVRRFCPQTSPQGELLSFTCRCAGGQWSCSGVYEGGGLFVGDCAPDGGA